MAELLATTLKSNLRSRYSRSKRHPGIRSLLLKTFAFELAIVVCELYNASLLGGYMPAILKTASVRPLPEQKPAKFVIKDIRPVSHTSQVSEVLGGLSASSLMGKSNTRVELQYKMATREKHSTGEHVSMTKLCIADRYWRNISFLMYKGIRDMRSKKG